MKREQSPQRGTGRVVGIDGSAQLVDIDRHGLAPLDGPDVDARHRVGKEHLVAFQGAEDGSQRGTNGGPGTPARGQGPEDIGTRDRPQRLVAPLRPGSEDGHRPIRACSDGHDGTWTGARRDDAAFMEDAEPHPELVGHGRREVGDAGLEPGDDGWDPVVVEYASLREHGKDGSGGEALPSQRHDLGGPDHDGAARLSTDENPYSTPRPLRSLGAPAVENGVLANHGIEAGSPLGPRRLRQASAARPGHGRGVEQAQLSALRGPPSGSWSRTVTTGATEPPEVGEEQLLAVAVSADDIEGSNRGASAWWCPGRSTPSASTAGRLPVCRWPACGGTRRSASFRGTGSATACTPCRANR